MTATDTSRIDILNDRANTLYGYILLGLATVDDILEFERTATALQNALCDDEVNIDQAGCDAWLDSHSSQDYLPVSEE